MRRFWRSIHRRRAGMSAVCAGERRGADPRLLTGLGESRLHLVPPFRRRLAEVPLGLDQPYWIEDPDFDIEFHARELVFPACGGSRLGHRTTLGADGMGGDPVEQQVGHRVGLLLEHKVADAVQRLEAVLPADITTAVLTALLHDRDPRRTIHPPRCRPTCADR